MALIAWFSPPLNVVSKGTDSSNQEDSEYSEAVTLLRNRSRLTQRQVAEALGITVQTVSNWENGVRTPKLTPRETLSLCKILKCSLEELAGDLPGNKE